LVAWKDYNIREKSDEIKEKPLSLIEIVVDADLRQRKNCPISEVSEHELGGAVEASP
jgi:hypothetical protein